MNTARGALLKKEEPYKAIFFFALPIFFSILFLQAYSWMDAFFLGQKNNSAFTAISLSGYLVYFATTFASGFPNGASVKTGILYGEGKHEEVRKSFAKSTLLCFLFFAISSILMLSLTEVLISVSGSPNDGVTGELRNYLYLLFSLGLLGIFLENWMISFFRSIGAWKESFILMASYSLVNIALDFVLVYLFNLGALGVALAYGISLLVATAIGFLLLKSNYPQYMPKLNDFRLDKASMRDCFRLAFTFGAQSALVGVGLFLLQRSVNAIGEDAINGYGVALKGFNLMALFSAAISSSVLNFMSQNAHDKTRVKKGLVSSSLILLAYSLFASIVLLCLKGHLCSFFLKDVGKAEAANGYCEMTLSVLALSFIVNVLLNLFRSVVFGLGKPLWSVLSCVGETIMRVVFALWITPSIGFSGVPYSDLAAWGLGAIVALIGVIIALKKNGKEKEEPLHSEKAIGSMKGNS